MLIPMIIWFRYTSTASPRKVSRWVRSANGRRSMIFRDRGGTPLTHGGTVRVVNCGQAEHPAMDILTDDPIRLMRLGIFDADRLVAGLLDRLLQ